jgi:hypothetical protein
MTMTLDETTEPVEHTDDARQARLERLRAFRKQMDQADRDADAGSLDRAADMAEEFDQKEWVKELPGVTKTHYRGQPIKVDGLSRFAGWAKVNIGYRPAHVYRLIRADEVHRIIFSSGESIPEGTGEAALRPLSKLLNHKDKRPDEIPQVWRRALQLSADDVPTEKQVGNALRAHDTATGRTPASRVSAYYQRTVKEEHKRGLRALVYIHDHGGEEALQAYVAAIQAQLDQWEVEAHTADPG